jgi:hypothetical protein
MNPRGCAFFISFSVWLAMCFPAHCHQAHAALQHVVPQPGDVQAESNGDSILRVRCSAPSVLVFDESSRGYAPNPFTVSVIVSCRGRDATNVAAEFGLPVHMDRVVPGDSLRKFIAARLGSRHGVITDSAVWKLRLNAAYLPRRDTTLMFRFLVTAADTLGHPLDTVEAACALRIAGVPIVYHCPVINAQGNAVTALRLNDDSTGVVPNPVPVRILMRNDGLQPFGIDTICMSGFYTDQGDSLALDPPGQAMGLRPRGMLGPGDSLPLEWTVRVFPSAHRDGAIFRFYVVDDEGRASAHGSGLDIPGLPVKPFRAWIAPGELQELAPDTIETAIVIDPAVISDAEGVSTAPPAPSLRNYPNPVRAGAPCTVEVTLSGARPMHATLTLHDLLGRTLRTLYEGMAGPGTHAVRLPASTLVPGVYICRLQTEAGTVETNMLVLK